MIKFYDKRFSLQNANFWGPPLKMIVTASGVHRELIKIFKDKWHKHLARVIKFCTSPQSLKKRALAKRIHEIRTTNVCLGCINGAKVNFTTTGLQFGHQKALVTDFIYQNQIFLRFWYKLLWNVPIGMCLSQMVYFLS